MQGIRGSSSGIFLLDPLVVAGRVLWIRVCPSLCPSILPSGRFLGIGSLVFSDTQHGVRGPCCAWQSQIFWKKNFCPKNGQKIGVFQFIGKFSHYFFLNLVYNVVFLHKSHGKIFVPEIWAKMLSANQITGFLNQLYL